MTSSFSSIFDKNIVEFATELKGAVPEYLAPIELVLAMASEERAKQFREQVLPGCAPTRDSKKCPGLVLPGVRIADSVWVELSTNSQEKIQQYLTILSFCCLYEHANTEDLSGSNPFGSLNFEEFQTMFSKIDFDGFTKKFQDFMKSSTFEKLPEKFMKGQLAKICEELIKEFTLEDFGLSEAEVKKYESEPHRMFELLTDVYLKKPEILQKAIQKIAKRFQEKFQKGQLRPEQIVAEAEEMMKEFSDNKAFVELMESFRSMFDFKDMDLARQAGRESSARLSLVKERLKKKLDAKKANNVGANGAGAKKPSK